MKKTLSLQTFQQLCSLTSAYLGKLRVHFLDLSLSTCNENDVFLFKNTYTKGKSPFLFERDIFC